MSFLIMYFGYGYGLIFKKLNFIYNDLFIFSNQMGKTWIRFNEYIYAMVSFQRISSSFVRGYGKRLRLRHLSSISNFRFQPFSQMALI